MLKKLTNFMIVLGASLSMIAAVVGTASAASATIEAAKRSCDIGEKADGYMGYKTTPSESLKREVDALNLRRRAAYAKLAQKKGVSVAVTAQLTAERVIKNMPAGLCYYGTDRKWHVK